MVIGKIYLLQDRAGEVPSAEEVKVAMRDSIEFRPPIKGL